MRISGKNWWLALGILVLLVFIFRNQISILDKGKATLSWTANAEENLAGYRVYYGLNPRSGDCPDGGYEEKMDVGKTDTPEKPSHVLKDLKIGRVYYFSVTTYNQSGKESCFSEEIKKRIWSLAW